MAAQVTANNPTPTQGEGSPTGTTRSLAIDTITEFTSANGVTVDKALTASAGLTTTTVTASGAISGTTGTFSGAITPTAGVAAAGGFVAAPRCLHTGAVPATQTTDGNDTTPSVTETYFAEVFIPSNVTVTGIAFFNGSAVGTDKWVGILYNSSGVVVANTALAGTTAVGTDAYQKIDLTATYAAKGPATYYVGLQCNGTTARFNTHILGAFGADKKTSEVFGTPTTITAPTAFVTARGPMATLY